MLTGYVTSDAFSAISFADLKVFCILLKNILHVINNINPESYSDIAVSYFTFRMYIITIRDRTFLLTSLEINFLASNNT